MDAPTFYALLATHFPHQLKSGQDQALKKLSVFLLEGEPRSVFVLRGFAGTGKTTMVGTLVKQLWKIRLSSVLLAPTGRAAKVISAMKNSAGLRCNRSHKEVFQSDFCSVIVRLSPFGKFVRNITKRR